MPRESGPSPSEVVQPEPTRALDSELFAELEADLKLEVLKQFEDPVKDPGTTKSRRELTREAFAEKYYAGNPENPVLYYPNLDVERIAAAESRLRAVKEKLISGDRAKARQMRELWLSPDKQDPQLVVKLAYLWRINEKVAELRMLRETHAATVEQDSTKRQRHLMRFTRYSEFTYGKPSKDIFFETIAALKSELTQDTDTATPEVTDLAQALMSELPPDSPHTTATVLPSVEDTAELRSVTEEEFPQLLAIARRYRDRYAQQSDIAAVVSTTETISDEDLAAAFNEALQALGAVGWRATLDQSATVMVVSHENKLLRIPADRSIPLKDLAAYLVHEVGTHVQRALVGERSRLMLLKVGLDRYVAGEEGVTVARMQALGAQASEAGWRDRHMAIALALGLDGKKRDFKDVFSILEKMYRLDELKKGSDQEKARAIASKKAWTLCIRVFRGTDCQTPGACYTKDIVYQEGQIGIWRLIAGEPHASKKFSLGKFDPTNPRHVWVLEQLGLTDEDLDSLSE